MPKNRYRIKEGMRIYYHGRVIDNKSLSNKIAEELLITGQYDNIIIDISPKKKKESEE